MAKEQFLVPVISVFVSEKCIILWIVLISETHQECSETLKTDQIVTDYLLKKLRN